MTPETPDPPPVVGPLETHCKCGQAWNTHDYRCVPVDPPPVSPDPWEDVEAVPIVGFGVMYPAADVNRARAADALRHQQELRQGDAEIEACRREIARLTQEPFRLTQELTAARAVAKSNYDACESARDQRDQLRAALSTAEATIHSQAKEIAESERARGAAVQEAIRFLGSDGVSPCGHYGLFMLTTVYEDGTERPECMQCCRDAAQDRAEAAEATIASLTAERDQLLAQRAESRRWKNLLELTTLRAERDRLHAALTGLRREHTSCEDCWFSCPKSAEGCCNDSQGEACNCGADEHNAKIDAARASSGQE